MKPVQDDIGQVSTFRIPHDHPCLPGHFPGRPVVPGVVILDHVIDAIERAYGPFASTLRLPQVKFMQPLLPEETATVQFRTMEGGRWQFRVLRGDALLAKGEVCA